MAAAERISPFYGFTIATLSFCAFIYFGRLVRRLGPLYDVSVKDRWKWNNLLGSWIHSVVIGSSCIYVLCEYPEMMFDLVDFHNIATYTIVAVSAGYFVSDSYDIIACGQMCTMRDVLIHHVSVMCCLTYSIAECQFIGHTVIGLVVEVNSVFLHLRKLMQIMHFGFQHPLYRLVCLMNLASFVVCRFAFSLILISHGLFVYRYRMSSFYFSMLVPTVVIMWVINIVLFSRLFTNDVLRCRPVQQPTADNNHVLSDAQPATTVVNNNHCAVSSDSRNKVD